MPRKKRAPTPGEQVLDMVFAPGTEERDRLSRWHQHMLVRIVNGRVSGAASDERHRCFEIMQSALSMIVKV